jgi:uncharacterized protein (TIGR03437 family)
MKLRLFLASSVLFLFSSSIWGQTATPSIVRFNTSLGPINVTLYPNSAPNTVANFLSYMNKGLYNNSFFSRSVQSGIFIIQGGGYQLINGTVYEIPTGPPILSEFGISNTLGTIAMALSADSSGVTDPNTATSQWFFNTQDNSGMLDSQGFTVFGQIGDAASLAVMNAIAALTPQTLASAVFPSIPLVNYTSPNAITPANLVLISSIAPLLPAPAVGTGGVITASGFGGFAAAASGSFVEIYGTNLAGTTRSWTTTDFSNGAAPTTIDGVTVTVNGQPAYVEFVSPGQVNVQIPANVPLGPVPVVVTYGSQTSPPVNLTINASEGGLLAPASFNVAGTQYVGATHASTGVFVSNGNIPGIAAAPAVPGETLVFYGVGFGPVTSSTTPVAGQIAQGATTLAAPVQFTFGSTVAQVSYQGFAPDEVGVYQFNVAVPSNLASGDVSLQVSQGGVPIPQTLSISIQ